MSIFPLIFRYGISEPKNAVFLDTVDNRIALSTMIIMPMDTPPASTHAKGRIALPVPLACSIEQAAVEFLEEVRWEDSPACPRCGGASVYKLRDRKTGDRNKRYLWWCKECDRQYTVRIGTIFEDSRIPLHHWCLVFWMASTAENGVNASEIVRETGLSYKSALFVINRIRACVNTDVGQVLPPNGCG